MRLHPELDNVQFHGSINLWKLGALTAIGLSILIMLEMAWWLL